MREVEETKFTHMNTRTILGDADLFVYDSQNTKLTTRKLCDGRDQTTSQKKKRSTVCGNFDKICLKEL